MANDDPGAQTPPESTPPAGAPPQTPPETPPETPPAEGGKDPEITPAYISQDEHKQAMENLQTEMRQEFGKQQEELRSNLGKALGFGPTQEEEQLPWIKEGRQATPIEFANWVADRNEKLRQEAEAKRQEESKQLEQKSEEAKEAREKQINEQWNQDLVYMQSQQLLPTVDEELQKKIDTNTLTEEEQRHPAVVAQAQLFNFMKSHNEKAVNDPNSGLKQTTNLYEIYYRYMRGNKQVPGAKAPVSAGKGSVASQQGEDDFYYDDIHGEEKYKDLAIAANQ